MSKASIAFAFCFGLVGGILIHQLSGVLVTANTLKMIGLSFGALLTLAVVGYFLFRHALNRLVGDLRSLDSAQHIGVLTRLARNILSGAAPDPEEISYASRLGKLASVYFACRQAFAIIALLIGCVISVAGLVHAYSELAELGQQNRLAKRANGTSINLELGQYWDATFTLETRFLYRNTLAFLRDTNAHERPTVLDALVSDKFTDDEFFEEIFSKLSDAKSDQDKLRAVAAANSSIKSALNIYEQVIITRSLVEDEAVIARIDAAYSKHIRRSYEDLARYREAYIRMNHRSGWSALDEFLTKYPAWGRSQDNKATGPPPVSSSPTMP